MKTSQQWYEELQDLYPDFMVMVPDGWYRSNYLCSWNEELITKEEFEARVASSTCGPNEMVNDITEGIYGYC